MKNNQTWLDLINIGSPTIVFDKGGSVIPKFIFEVYFKYYLDRIEYLVQEH